MNIQLLGTGDAYATDRANSAILVRIQNYQLLIDCGPTVCRELWQQPNWENLDAVYFTHLHPDHALGLATLVNRFNSIGRTKALHIFCHANKEQRLQQLVEYGFWSDRQNYAVEFTLWDEKDLSKKHTLGPFECRSQLTRHSVDNHSIRISEGSHHLFYSGDGCVIDKTARLISGCKYALIECQRMSYPQGAGHSDFTRVLELAKANPNTQFLLYHISEDQIEAMTLAADVIDNIDIAKQGEQLLFYS